MITEKSNQNKKLNQICVANQTEITYFICPYCNKKFQKLMLLFNHLNNFHLKKEELQEMINIYHDFMVEVQFIDDITDKLLNSDQYLPIKDILIQKFLVQGNNNLIFEEFFSQVDNKTVLKYKTLFKKQIQEYLKFLTSKIV
ncbi:MAG: hypothetical protein EAX96_02105 [Candidatus Lokiarchaeota archaeon]|nr:hypothetical protein [Candidatus Lokiarchaeota archaeon]